MYKWTQSKLSYDRRQVYFEVEFEGAHVNKRTVGDLYITKARDGVQMLALNELNAQVVMYGMPRNERLILPYLGPYPTAGIGRIRDVDTYFMLNQNLTALFEVDGKSRDLPASHAYCLEHFAVKPSLRAVLLLKVLLRGRDFARIAIVAVLYLLREGVPAVADAVAFGTRPLDAADAIPLAVAHVLRSLPPVPLGPRHPRSRLWASPWTSDQRPYIVLPAAAQAGGGDDDDVAAGGDRGAAAGGGAALRRGGRRRRGVISQPDLVVDLWRIYRGVEILAESEADSFS